MWGALWCVHFGRKAGRPNGPKVSDKRDIIPIRTQKMTFEKKMNWKTWWSTIQTSLYTYIPGILYMYAVYIYVHTWYIIYVRSIYIYILRWVYNEYYVEHELRSNNATNRQFFIQVSHKQLDQYVELPTPYWWYSNDKAHALLADTAHTCLIGQFLSWAIPSVIHL